MKLFIPRMYHKNIYDIDFEKIIKNGYKLIIFDLDNTIGNINENICSREAVDFINNLNKKIKVVIASNSGKKRVLNFCQDLECDKYYLSLKPLSRVLKKIRKKTNINYQDMVIIGDQLLTDIFLGNRYNLLTILVDKKDEMDLNITKINRKMENIIKKKYNIRKGEYYK